MRKVLGTLAALAVLAVSAPTADAQEGFNLGYTDIGATLGLGNIGSASIAFGGRFEKAIRELPDFGDGILGIQAAVDFYTWSYFGYSVRYIPIGVTGNYHFRLQDRKIDPFLGLGLGYFLVSCSGRGTLSSCGYSSSIYVIAKAGIRYFFRDNMALYADAGAGAAALNVGLMFKMR